MCIEDDATKNEERQKRARYHSAILDANTLLPRQDFKDLPETYVHNGT